MSPCWLTYTTKHTNLESFQLLWKRSDSAFCTFFTINEKCLTFSNFLPVSSVLSWDGNGLRENTNPTPSTRWNLHTLSSHHNTSSSSSLFVLFLPHFSLVSVKHRISISRHEADLIYIFLLLITSCVQQADCDHCQLVTQTLFSL